MSQNFWLIIVFFVTMVCNISCRPQDGASTFTALIQKSVESETPSSIIELSTENQGHQKNLRLKEEENVNTTKETKLNIESIANVARASNDRHSMPPSIANGQLFHTVGQMVDSDVRTPPKLSQFIKEKHSDKKDSVDNFFKPMPVTFIYEDEDIPPHEVTERIVLEDASEGKAIRSDSGVQGIAIPVLMDDLDYNPTVPPKKLQKISGVLKPLKDEKKKTGVTKFHQTTTPSSKLSTWILLSDNKETTTPLPKKNSNKKTNGNNDNDSKKKIGENNTTKKPTKVSVTTLKPHYGLTQKKGTVKPITSGTKKPELNISVTSTLETLLNTQKKSSANTLKSKNGTQKRPTNDSIKKTEEKVNVAEVKEDHVMVPQETKTTYTIPTKLMLTTEDGISVTEPNLSTLSDKTSQEPTKKKKSSSKKKKKNKNKKKKTETGVEMKTPDQPVGSQIYNFLSREIVPTVGLGLIGVALTAGLASFLGYNPFATATVPLRRTYETNHGYSPSLNYDYNANYGDGGQSEEVLFREVLSGMPEESRYDLTHADSSYRDTYNRQDQVYPTASGTIYNSEKNRGTYDSNYSQDYSYGLTYNEGDKNYSTENQEKYPVYTRETGTSFVYPETTGMTSAEKSTRINDDQETQNNKYNVPRVDTIERHPEALYRVASESDIQYRTAGSTIHNVNSQNNWHRIGKPMESIRYYAHVEPGPRSLDLNRDSKKNHQIKKRSKRSTNSVIQRIARKKTKKENDAENEIDFDESFTDQKNNDEQSFNDIPFTTISSKPTTLYEVKKSPNNETTENSTKQSIKEIQSTTTEEFKDTESTESFEATDPDTSTTTTSNAVSVLDVLKRLAEFKLRLGLSFLRSTTDMFSRYLDDIQRRVDESFTNTTTTTVHYNKKRNIWSRIFNAEKRGESNRKKRSALKNSQFLASLLAEEEKENSKSTKKDLKFSTKIFLQKKNVPKKYESNTRN